MYSIFTTEIIKIKNIIKIKIDQIATTTENTIKQIQYNKTKYIGRTKQNMYQDIQQLVVEYLIMKYFSLPEINEISDYETPLFECNYLYYLVLRLFWPVLGNFTYF